MRRGVTGRQTQASNPWRHSTSYPRPDPMSTAGTSVPGDTGSTLPADRLRPFPLWVRLILLVDLLPAVAAGAMAFMEPGSGEWITRIGAVLVLLPYVAVGVLAWTRPRPAVRGVAMAMAFFLTGALLLLALFAGASSSADMEGAELWLVLLALANGAVVIWAIVATIRSAEGILEVFAAFVLSWIYPALAYTVAATLGGVVALGGFALEHDAEQGVAEDIMRVQRCAFEWATSHPGEGFPRTLEDMAAAGSRCAGGKLMAAARKDHLRYQPARGRMDEPVGGFTVQASRPVRGESTTYHARGDATGLQVTWRSRAGSPADPPRGDGVPERLGGLRDCVEHMRLYATLPATVAEMMAGANAARRGGCEPYRVKQLADTGSRRWLEERQRFRLSYTAGDGDYRLEARPVEYGETALRSYLLTSGNALHVTHEDRAATAADLRLPDCLPHDVGDCVATPALAPPRVAFLHDTVVEAGRSFELRMRVAGDTTRWPQRLSWGWQCDAPADSAAVPPPSFQPNAYEFRCSADRGRVSALGDRMLVRVWLRSAGGMTAYQEDTVRILAAEPVER